MKYILLWLCLVSTLHAQPPSRTRPKQDSLPSLPIAKFVQPDDALPFVEVEINGKPAYFLLDTGSGSSVIDINQFEKYEIEAVPLSNMTFRGIGGTSNNKVQKITNVSVVTINKKNYTVNFLATDLHTIISSIASGVKLNILGIIGSDFFEYHKVIIDYRKNTIIFLDNTVIPIRRKRNNL
jgi:hypothetical protein